MGLWNRERFQTGQDPSLGTTGTYVLGRTDAHRLVTVVNC